MTTPTKSASVNDIAAKLRLIDRLPDPKTAAKEESDIGIHDNRVNDAFIGRNR